MLVTAYTDVGIRRETNQDSICVKIAATDVGEITMAVICDGMGGLEQGEIASASVVRAMEGWFEQELPKLLEVLDVEKIKLSLEQVIQKQNRNIMEYGQSCHVQLGTTMTALLIIGEKLLLISHIGDTRVYQIDSGINVLTEDQTVVARAIRNGELTEKEAETDSRKNVLLQCIGASKHVKADFIEMLPKKNTVYMLCSDGFRHKLTSEEILEGFRPEWMLNEDIMRNRARQMVELNKARKETDNISVVIIKNE